MLVGTEKIAGGGNCGGTLRWTQLALDLGETEKIAVCENCGCTLRWTQLALDLGGTEKIAGGGNCGGIPRITVRRRILETWIVVVLSGLRRHIEI